ncbi:MAG: hypothetical protein HY529_00735 [Chloroflexi bacterium]|nr:hypothetical protein [Chloroflexota bacterium]
MPNPKDYIDEDHQYVGGYVRRKHAIDTAEPRRISWFWRIAWYWRLLIILSSVVAIIISSIVVIMITVTKTPFILIGIATLIVFWAWFLHPTRRRSMKLSAIRRRAGKSGKMRLF